MNPKFKVGDKVRVFRASTHAEERLWDDAWFTISMDCMIGKVYEIECVCDVQQEKEFTTYVLGGYNLPEFVLQNEIRIGQQLLFNFMEK